MRLKPGYKQTGIGIIPKNWRVKRIRSVASCTAGGTPSTLNPEYWNGNIPWMSSGELHHKQINEVEGAITKNGLLNSSAKIIPAGCVLVGLAGQGRTRGTVAMNLIPLCTNQSIAAILPNPDFVVSEYLYHNLDSRYIELREISSGGGGRGGLNLTIISSINIPLPSIQEQRTIATVLNDTDALLNALHRLIAKKHNLKRAFMQQLLTGKTRLPGFEGIWKKKVLKELLIYERPDRYIVKIPSYSGLGEIPVLTANK
ncbi:MAG: restriction endonuclease subunit S [Gammaproteobacteria bacterium]|nr:restriction endonuclease subunit S [Gammaproteobacteria bacterium]